MIPLLIGAAAVGLGAVLMSDDKPKQEAVTQNKQRISDKTLNQRLNRAGRRIKTVGQDVPNYQTSSGMRFICSGNPEKDIEKIDNMIASPNVSDEFTIEAIRTFERYYNINIFD